MLINMMKSKIHRATVTDANINYIGSITIDKCLMEAAGIYEGEKVQVLNINNGERFETYALKGEANSGQICLNGAAARLAQVGDLVIIIAYCWIDEEKVKADDHKSMIVHVNPKNEMIDL